MQKTSIFQRARSGLARWVGGKPVQVRRFQAARMDRLTADWLTTEQSINEELRTDLTRLRSRGRELLQNNDYAVKFQGMVKNNIVGPNGIRLQVRIEDAPGKPDRMASAAIESAWADWCKACDISGQLHLRDFCETLVGGLPSDGEFLVRMVLGADAGNKYNFALQAIDVDRIDTNYNTTNGPSGNSVIMGVEVDTYRRPVALHLFVAHPNDGAQGSRMRMRVPLHELIHRFKVERPEQMRGIPWMAAGMLSLHHLGSFKLSALLAAEHGANHYGFFTTPDGQSPLGELDGSGQTITPSQPGMYDTLPTGAGFIPHESKYPNEVFGPFVKTTLQRIASGWRVAYHSLANDLEGVSYSSIRSGALEERDRWSADQEWFINVFMEPVYQAWLEMALLSGAITMVNGSALPAAKRDKFAKHEWQPRRWEWVDPKGDMEAKILAVRAGLMAPQDIANAMGYDFDDTLSSIALANKRAAELKVLLPAYDPAPGANAAQQTTPPDTAAAAAKELQALQAARGLDEMRQDIALLKREAPAPIFNNHFTMPEIRNDTHNHIAPTPVEIRNEITTPEPHITVEAILPEQRSEAPVVNVVNQVQPAEVVVNNTHPARAVQVVQRDANDEITQTVTTYEA